MAESQRYTCLAGSTLSPAQQATPLMTVGLQRLKLFERRRTVWRKEASSGAHVGKRKLVSRQKYHGLFP